MAINDDRLAFLLGFTADHKIVNFLIHSDTKLETVADWVKDSGILGDLFYEIHFFKSRRQKLVPHKTRGRVKELSAKLLNQLREG